MTEKREYTLLVNKERIPVSEEVYRAYYQERERQRYLEKRSRGKELSRQALQEMGYPVDLEAGALVSGEEAYFNRSKSKQLEDALSLLSPDEQEHLWALVCGEKTERSLAKDLGLSPATVHRRKVKALEKVRKAYERME